MRILGTLLVFCTALMLPECLLAQTSTAKPDAIRIDIGGLRNNNGQVVCDLYSSSDGFPKDSRGAIEHAVSSISDRRATCEFRGIKPGSYAVSVFHDENSNGKLDSNFLGIPREGVGASNGARGHLGPPKFDAAVFHFSGGRLDLKITIIYL